MKGGESMSKVQVFSKKLGKTVSIERTEKSVHNTVMGWMDSGWSKSGGWKLPKP